MRFRYGAVERMPKPSMPGIVYHSEEFEIGPCCARVGAVIASRCWFPTATRSPNKSVWQPCAPQSPSAMRPANRITSLRLARSNGCAPSIQPHQKQ